MKRLVIFAFLTLFIFACAQKEVTIPDESKRTHDAGKKESTGKEDVTTIDKENIRDNALSQEDLRREMESIFSDIHFAYNRYDITDEAKPVLRNISDWMLKRTKVSILVEGHCDERGTNEYNLALGDQRAQAAKNYIVSLGVPASRIETVSFGKEQPLCTEKSEECWAKNRRAHFVMSK